MSANSFPVPCDDVAVSYQILVALGPAIISTGLACATAPPWKRWRLAVLGSSPAMSFMQELLTFASFAATGIYLWVEPCTGQVLAFLIFVVFVVATLGLAVGFALRRHRLHQLGLRNGLKPRPGLAGRLPLNNPPALEVLQAVGVHLAFIVPALYLAFDTTSFKYLRGFLALVLFAMALTAAAICAARLHIVQSHA